MESIWRAGEFIKTTIQITWTKWLPPSPASRWSQSEIKAKKDAIAPGRQIRSLAMVENESAQYREIYKGGSSRLAKLKL